MTNQQIYEALLELYQKHGEKSGLSSPPQLTENSFGYYINVWFKNHLEGQAIKFVLNKHCSDCYMTPGVLADFRIVGSDGYIKESLWDKLGEEQ